MIGRIVKVEKDGRIIRLWIRFSQKDKKMIQVVDFYPYFYVPDKNGEYMSIDNVNVKKITTDDPSKVPSLRSKYVKHYEADIPYTRRFLIDLDLYDCVDVPLLQNVSYKSLKPATCNIPYRIWFIDIEVKSDVLPDFNNPEHPIVSITIYDSYVDKYVSFVLGKTSLNGDDNWKILSFDSEDELILNFLRLYNVSQPDILVGWNVRFDVNYIKARFEALGYDISFDGVQIFDMMEGFKRLFKRPSYKLKMIALEEGLIDSYKSFNINMSIDEIVEYNYTDVKIMVELEKKYGVLDFHLNLRSITGVNEIEDAFYNSVLVDTMLLRIAKKFNIVLPSKPEQIEEEEYEGAIVLEPPKGIFDNVAVFDMARYYPNIILSFNISPDTLDDNGQIKYPKTSVAFRNDRQGLIPSLVKNLLVLREQLEKSNAPKNKIDAVKFLTNSIYGVFAHERFRLYDVRLASTVTAIGREGILYVKKLAEEKGFKVLYGDTDSIMIQIPFDQAEQLVKYLNEEIERYFKERYNVSECTIGLKFEKYFDKIMFFGVKKRYAGILVWEKGKEKKELVTVGLEVVRTDQSKFSKEFQENLLKLVLSGASKKQVYDFINKSIEEMKKAPLIDIAIVKGLSKSLDEYKANAPHVRATLYSNKYLGTRFGKGSRIYFVWVKDVKNLPKTDVIAFDEDTKLPEIIVDWKKMEEVNIWQKAEPILDVINSIDRGLKKWF